jgi:hypothetical protein
MRDWYERTLGEVPRYVGFLLKHRRQLLKSWRNRYENILVELPKQIMPYTQLHSNVMRGFGHGIRENILFGRAFGMTKDQVFTSIFSAMLNAGPEALNIVDSHAGDILAAEWQPPEPAVGEGTSLTGLWSVAYEHSASALWSQARRPGHDRSGNARRVAHR